jgi:hypothetical protein
VHDNDSYKTKHPLEGTKKPVFLLTARAVDTHNFIMKTRHIISVVSAISVFGVQGQDFSTYIKENAIKIDKLDSLNIEVYKSLVTYKLIMIGEMHGTNEPAKFVIGLTRLLTEMGDSVQVGLEIPSQQMTKYLDQPKDSNILSSDFFVTKSYDGKASFAWAEIISRLNKNPKVRFFFYDINKGDCQNSDDRDSVMYIKVKNEIKEHQRWKTITLSGNIHNMLIPYKNKSKMALYLIKDNELNLSDKVCSLNHYYQSGTMLNNTGNGLTIHHVNNSEADYSNAVDYENYLLIFRVRAANRYSGIYFTRDVTAVKMVNFIKDK